MTISNSSRPPSEPPLSAPLPRLSRAGGDDPDGAPNYRILALDDDERLLNAIRRLLRTRGLNVEPCTDPQRALAMVEAEPYRYDLMMLDVNLGRTDITGLGVLHQIRQLAPDLPVVMLTADASAQTAVAALKAGAFHYLVKPLEDRDVVELTLRKAGRVGQLHKKVREFERRVSIEDRFPRLIGASAAMRRVFTDIENAAQTDMNVLILGESGTGKELVAREIHEHSSRGERQIVPLNCGAIQESLIDGELFGHLKGAFTGASSDKRGVFSEANGGTLFLDEIGELPLNVQPRLLRVLQEGEVRPVGSTRPRKVDVRVIAATNIDLEDAAARGEFRQDLYYRLNVITIHLPPLRQRMDDLPLLVDHLLAKHAARTGRSTIPRLTHEAMDRLMEYGWPGNVRQLENTVMQMLATVPDDEIGAAALPQQVLSDGRAASPRLTLPAISDTLPDTSDGDSPDGPDLRDLRWADSLAFREAKQQITDRFEREYTRRLLRLTAGNVSEAARRAGLDRANFRRLLQRLGVDPAQYRDS